MSPYEKERLGSGNFPADMKWGEEIRPKKLQNKELLDQSPEWNRYNFHAGRGEIE